ncbi:RNA polymerase sigma-70 factor, ECF subfamily [Modicisalibacter muralis]|uniref:RNA polymerase sigma factor n=1 Tax=Modicisalibacter muralis TaxID=119000 RepID=A0A1G9J1A1_9GAMM|nr:RNA polymerase sigma factor [Halomonas muralis]SDL31135.1 RNA polymerase sigma-70 factor, ECF subfamily [Halomonas muralis]
MKLTAEILDIKGVGPDTPESELVDLARNGQETAVREIIRRMNPKLFRIARGIVDSDAIAEEVVQEAYLIAFTRISEFRSEAKFATWITRITLNAAKMHLRKIRPTQEYDSINEPKNLDVSVVAFPGAKTANPESEQGRAQFRALIESAVTQLPSTLRVAFVLREVEGMSVTAIAEDLEISAITVKTRLFRARRHLRGALEEKIKGGFDSIFPFDGLRCANMANSVIEILNTATGTEK